MKITKKNIKEKANKQGYTFYDYYVDDYHTENKYYIKNIYSGKLYGFDRLAEILDFLKCCIEYEIINITQDKSIEYVGKNLYRSINENTFICRDFNEDFFLNLNDFEKENYINELDWNLF